MFLSLHQMSAGPHVPKLADFEILMDLVVDEHRTLFPEVNQT